MADVADGDFGLRLKSNSYGAGRQSSFGKASHAHGAAMADVFKITIFLRDRENFDKLSQIRREYLPGAAYISTGFITELIRQGMLIEVEAQAYLGR